MNDCGSLTAIDSTDSWNASDDENHDLAELYTRVGRSQDLDRIQGDPREVVARGF